MQTRTLNEAKTPADRKLLQDIKRVGWHVVIVAEEEGLPGYGYTVGLSARHNHPELVIFGPPPDAVHELLNGLGALVSRGEKFADGGSFGLFEDGRDVRFVAFPTGEYADHLDAALWLYRGDAFPALQVLWADKRGFYPTDAEFDRRLREQQPLPGRENPVGRQKGTVPMKKFDYKIVTSTDSDEDDETMLKELGGEGWELVNVHVSEVTYVQGDDEDDEDAAGEEYVEEVVTYYLKKELA